MQDTGGLLLSLENNFGNAAQNSGLNPNGQAIVDGLICGTILTLLEQNDLETASLAMRRLKSWTDLEAFSATLDILTYSEKDDFRASLYKTFLCFHNNGGKVFEEVSRLSGKTTAEEISVLRTSFLALVTNILDITITALPELQSIEVTEAELNKPSNTAWRQVLTQDATERNRSDAQMAREQFTQGLFEAVDSAARMLTSEPDNVASYDAYVAQAEAVLSNREVYASIALDFKGHHDLFLSNVIGYRLKPNDSKRLFALLHEVEKLQVETFLADHTNPDLQYIYEAFKATYDGSISNWCMHHTNFTFYPALQRTGLENHEAFDIEIIHSILAASVRKNYLHIIDQTCDFLKSLNLVIPDNRMAELISKLIASDNEAAACKMIDITPNLEVVDPVTKSTLLMQAALKYQVSVVTKLLEKGAKVNAQRATDRKTVIHLLVEAPRARGNNGDLNTDKIAALLSIFERYRANINLRDSCLKTPLMHTLDRTDRISVSAQLLDMGAVAALRNDNHQTALQQMYDSRFFNANLATKIVEAGNCRNDTLNALDFGVVSMIDSAVLAIKSQQMVLEKLKFILQNCTRVTTNATFGDNNNYLHYSIIYYNGIQSAQIINFLCRAGVNVNAINSNQFTPLALAAQNALISDDVIAALLLNKAEPNPRHDSRNTLDDLVNNHPTLPASLNKLLLDLNQNNRLPGGFNRHLNDEDKALVIENIQTILTHVLISNAPLSPAFASPIALNSPVQRSAVEDRGGRNLGKRKEKENDGEGPNSRRRLGLE